ncbi:glycosyl hydrolase [Pontiellaceae bacterium B12227]|nr:glycosyl hydrolase [Pontiellaceae bacterium B12227]
MKFFVIGLWVLGAYCAGAATIVQDDVTAVMGPGFFLDDAAIGGGDTTTGNINLTRTFSGLQLGAQGCEVIITGIGWASSAGGTTATEATATITYLGADGVWGGGDDVVIGSATDALLFSGAGEYAWQFDTPLRASIDGLNSLFRININTGGTGNIRYKKDNASGDVKISAAGYSVGVGGHNVALYRDVDATLDPDFARYATDGVVGFDYAWIGDSSLPHSLAVEFPGPVEIGSCHLYSGANGFNQCTAWKLYYQTAGSGWLLVPGSEVTGNTLADRSVVFPPLFVEKLKLEITASGGDGKPRIREWAVFPPNDGSGFPIGTGVTLSMVKESYVEASTYVAGQFPRFVNDGYLGNSWISQSDSSHSIEFHMRDEIRIGSAHLYSGDGAGSGIVSNFNLEYSGNSGTSWQAVPGGAVTGNTNEDLVITFSSDVFADRVRLSSSDAGSIEIREFLVFPENGQGGYPLGTDVNPLLPPLNEYETYSDSFYHLRPAGESRVLHSGVPGVVLANASDSDLRQAYQLLLNVGTDTYRIFNRSSRQCLAVEEASLNEGASVVEETYSGFPSQQWRVWSADNGLVYIENVWSRMCMELGPDGRIRQMNWVGSFNQKWNVDFVRDYPKKGFAGYASLAADGGASWYYGWTAKDVSALNTGIVDFNPMQWGGGNLQSDSYQADKGQLPITIRYPEWSSRGYPFTLMGFNEPDGAEQANISVETAIERWPQLMVGRQPLVSPVAVGWTRQWMTDFMTEADNLGYRQEYLGMHTYPGPNAANVVSQLESFSATYDDRPVVLSEFGFVDWSNDNNWSENLVYREMLELLWRLENSEDCKRYSMFGFIENEDYPEPAEPTGRVRRSNWQYADGSFTPLGEMWMGWRGESAPVERRPYMLHNRSFDMRVQNTGSVAAGAANIRTNDTSVQVYLEPVGNGYFYLVSPVDHSRLRQVGTTGVEWAASDTATPDAQWSWSMVEFGWHLISNRGSGRNLRYTPADGMHMHTGTGVYLHWFFVPPMTPVYPYPDTYENWSAVAFDGAPDGVDTSDTGHADDDSISNLAEYFFLLDPLVTNSPPVVIANSGGTEIHFSANRFASDVAWSVETRTNLMDGMEWIDSGYSIESQVEIGDRLDYVVAPDEQSEDARFYRVRIEK